MRFTLFAGKRAGLFSAYSRDPGVMYGNGLDRPGQSFRGMALALGLAAYCPALGFLQRRFAPAVWFPGFAFLPDFAPPSFDVAVLVHCLHSVEWGGEACLARSHRHIDETPKASPDARTRHKDAGGLEIPPFDIDLSRPPIFKCSQMNSADFFLFSATIIRPACSLSAKLLFNASRYPI